MVRLGRISWVGWTEIHLIHLLVYGQGRYKKEKAGKKGEQAAKEHRLSVLLVFGWRGFLALAKEEPLA